MEFGLINICCAPSSLVLGFLALGLALLHLRRKYSFWSSRGVAGPTVIPLVGYIGNTLFQPWTKFHCDCRKKFGRFYGQYEGTQPVAVVGDPDLIKAIFVKEFNVFPNRRKFQSSDEMMNNMVTSLEGDDWRRVRALLTPTFTSGKMRKMFPSMRDCSEDLMGVLEEKAQTKSPIDVKLLWSNYSLDVIARCCFATRTNANKNPDNEFVKMILNMLKIRAWKLVLLFLLPSAILERLPIDLFPRESMVYIVALVRHLIKQRGISKLNESDFLQFMVDTLNKKPNQAGEALENPEHVQTKGQGDDEAAASEAAFDMSRIKKKTLDETEMIANSIVFFFAGYETTGTLLTFASYCLAVHADLQERLHQEIKGACQDENGLTHDVIVKLDYLDAFISETLRMYPAAFLLERRAQEDWAVPGRGSIVLPKGTLVQVPVYAIHHDAEYFPNPEKFDPERFLPENAGRIVPYSYLPFGAGPRNCIGMRFALLEAKLVLAEALLKYRFVPTSETVIPVVFANGPTILPKTPIMVGVERR